MQSDKALLVGISGVSSSGKTTLARLLRDTWPKTVILHEDDFYLPDSELPMRDGFTDWDALECIDQSKLLLALQHMKHVGELLPDLESKEDNNSVGEIRVDQGVVADWQKRAHQLVQSGKQKRPLFLVDGFLLYANDMAPIWRSFDLKLFLRTTYSSAKARREARTGYVTIEGFWEDPPGYVDKIVWPHYVEYHGFLFKDRDVEGPYDSEVCDAVGIKPAPQHAENDMTACFVWACEMLSQLYSP